MPAKKSELVIIGKNISEQRHEMGLSQPKFATKFNLHTQYLQAVEQGRAISSLKWLIDLSEKMDVPLSRFVRGL